MRSTISSDWRACGMACASSSRTGTFLRAPEVEVPSTELLLSRISIYAARLGGPTEARMQSPEVLSSAWRAANGRVAMALAGINLQPLVATVRFPATAYGLPATTRIVRHDEQGTKSLGTLGTAAGGLRVDVGALQGIVLELIPPGS